MCNEPRTFDLAARGGRFVEAVNGGFSKEVPARLHPIFGSHHQRFEPKKQFCAPAVRAKKT